MSARIIIFFLLVALTLPGSAAAQPQAPASYVTPFPENDTYRLQVWGDELAEGLMTGLVLELADDPRVLVQRRHRAVGMLMRPDPEDDLKAIESDISRENGHIVVIMLGVGDRQPLRLPNGRRAAVGSDAWRAEYGRRIDRITRAFKARNIAVYWVGLPIMRRQDASEDAQSINEVLRERVHFSGLRFIDVYQTTANEDGDYDAFGPDLDGNQRRLRQQDGISFTRDGNRKLAHFVAREIRRDLVQARGLRAVPLAGGEAEQRLIRPLRLEPPPAARAGPAVRAVPTATTDSGAAAGEGGLPAGSGRVRVRRDGAAGATGEAASEEIDLPRPAISSTLLAALARREPSEAARPAGDALPRALPGGLVVTQTILGAGGEGGGAPRNVLPSQTPYFRVLVKGERLEPRPGRADDPSWTPPGTAPRLAPGDAARR